MKTYGEPDVYLQAFLTLEQLINASYILVLGTVPGGKVPSEH